MTRVLIVVLVLVLLAGCTQAPELGSGVTIVDDLGNGIVRFVDAEWNVVCYVVSNGIDCVPLSATGVDY